MASEAGGLRSEPRQGLFRRVLARAAVILIVVPAVSWLFLAGLRALPRLDDPANAFLGAGYSVAWILFCVITARLYQRAAYDRVQCRSAERAAAQAERLAQLTGALAQARTPSAAIEAALQEPLHALGADAGLLLLIGRDGGTLDVVRTVGYRTAERDARTAASLGGTTPATVAVGRGAAVLIETPRAWDAECPGSRGAFAAIAAIPLLVGSRVVAIVQLEFRAPRAFDQPDREYLEALATRAAQALDRTWQHESAVSGRAEADAQRQRAERELVERHRVEAALRASEARYRALVARTTRLHGLAAALSEAATLGDVARAIVRQGRNVLGAASGDLAMLVDEGAAFETVYSDGPRADGEEVEREAATPGLCATEAVRTREPVLVGSFDQWQECYARSAAIAADGGYVSSATLPLLVDGEAVGVLAFHFTAPVNFDDDYRNLLVSVAQHCAEAVERARLYEAADQARAEAETANRHKDELVSIVSHELRTPLNAILGWTSMLQQGILEGHGSARALQSIADNAARQVRLVEELLDFSRLQSGRMALEMKDVDFRALLRDVMESIIPMAAAGEIDLEVSPVPPVHLSGDARRLEQVFLNLLGNALKFTPGGGRVAVKVAAGPDAVEVRISDTGPGIDPEFLPHIFEAFRQADAVSARRYGGAGLGLSIAKELVDAHHGQIAAESAGIGRGATFIVTLPIARPPDYSQDSTNGRSSWPESRLPC
jgi:signal transduction histidine kinase